MQAIHKRVLEVVNASHCQTLAYNMASETGGDILDYPMSWPLIKSGHRVRHAANVQEAQKWSPCVYYGQFDLNEIQKIHPTFKEVGTHIFAGESVPK